MPSTRPCRSASRSSWQQCAAELTSLRDDQKLPAAAASALDAIIARAEAGKWEDAQNRLSDFMEGQRR